MSRFLTSGAIKRIASAVSESRSSNSHSGFKRYGTVAHLGSRLAQSRHSTGRYQIPRIGSLGVGQYAVKQQFGRSFVSRSYYEYNAYQTWRRLLARAGENPTVISKIAQAFSLALTRSPLLLPGVLALTCGQMAWAERSIGDTYQYPYPLADSLYNRAQDGRAYITSMLYSVVEGLILLVRAWYLMILFTPSIVMAPFADWFGPGFRSTFLQVVLRTLELAGPAFIKWGQWAATRPDLFPRDLCTKLSELQTKAPEHSYAYTKKSVERAFGRKISEIFEGFEEQPLASGSIAQVHRASLRFRYPGQKQAKPLVVAVKVRHPGVGESIRRDFTIINLVAKMSRFIPALNWLRLDESVQQFGVFMMSQVDLAREAAHLSRFIYNFRSWRDVSFPKPVYPLVHPAVLVETYEQGECVSHYVDDLVGHERVKAALAHIGTHALLKMLLVDNFIHADMHPGNILVRVAQNKPKKRLFKSKPHVIFLDVGMTAELSKSDRVNLLEFFKAVARRDGRTAAESALLLSKQQRCPNPKAFIEEMEDSFDFWGTPEGDLIPPAECMQELLEKVRRHKVNIDGNVCTVMVTTLVLEGWQRKLDPRYNVMQTLQTLLLRTDWAKSLSYTIDGLMAP
ncbi:Probable serine/threonine-protein kinase abkC [Linum perenne]